MPWEKETHHEAEVPFKFWVAPNPEGSEVVVGQDGVDMKSDPMAIRLDSELGWVAEELGPKSGHWKRLARKAHLESLNKEGMKDKILGKRSGPTSIKVLENTDTTWRSEDTRLNSSHESTSRMPSSA